MSTSTQAIKLEVQNDGMEEIRDAAKRKGRKSNFKYNKGFCHGKKQRVTQVAMTRYQGSRQRGKVLPGQRPKESFERVAAPSIEKVKKTKAGENGDMPKMEGKRAKKSTGVCDNLEEVDLNIGYIEEDVVDGFLFQSYGKATDLPPMQPMSNPEEHEPERECWTSIASHQGPCCTSAVDTLFVGATFSTGTWGRTSLGRRSSGSSSLVS